MKTLEILLEASKNDASIRVWGLAQRAINRIGFSGLAKVQNQLRLTDPNFFKPASMR